MHDHRCPMVKWTIVCMSRPSKLGTAGAAPHKMKVGNSLSLSPLMWIPAFPFRQRRERIKGESIKIWMMTSEMERVPEVRREEKSWSQPTWRSKTIFNFQPIRKSHVICTRINSDQNANSEDPTVPLLSWISKLDMTNDTAAACRTSPPHLVLNSLWNIPIHIQVTERRISHI